MNTKKLLRIIAIVVIMAALVASGYSLASARASLVQKDQDAHNLAGAWLVTAAFDPEFETPPFSAPAAFTKDGLIINSSSDGLVAIGVWEQVKGSQYAVTFTGYEPAEETSIHYMMKASIELSQDGSQFAGRFANDVYDADGNLLVTVTGTIQGERIQVIPLE